MIFSEIKLYELLKEKMGEKEAEAFVQALETKVKLEERNIEYVLERELKESLLTKSEAKILLSSKEDVAKLDARLTARMLYFWIGQISIIALLIFYFFVLRSH